MSKRLSDLPPQLLYKIGTYLPYDEYKNLQITEKKNYKILHSDKLKKLENNPEFRERSLTNFFIRFAENEDASINFKYIKYDLFNVQMCYEWYPYITCLEFTLNLSNDNIKFNVNGRNFDQYKSRQRSSLNEDEFWTYLYNDEHFVWFWYALKTYHELKNNKIFKFYHYVPII